MPEEHLGVIDTLSHVGRVIINHPRDDFLLPISRKKRTPKHLFAQILTDANELARNQQGRYIHLEVLAQASVTRTTGISLLINFDFPIVPAACTEAANMQTSS